jgi:ABC-type Fe3+-hydroxamate transport system substrate-binding protein
MKKGIALSLILLLTMGLLSACTTESSTDSSADSSNAATDNIKFTATIDEVSDSELLVTVLDNENFNQARINIDGFDGLDFQPEVGQTISVTVKNQVGMSEPPFMNPISIELVK